jgi:hypothetical protein
MYKKTLNKIHIYHVFKRYFNYSSIDFIKLKSNIKPSTVQLLCIHIIFEGKIADLLKIQGQEKKSDNKKKRDRNLAFLTFTIRLIFLYLKQCINAITITFG